VALGALSKLENAKLSSDASIVSMLLNPKSLSITRGANWSSNNGGGRTKTAPPAASGGMGAPVPVGCGPLQYMGSQPGQLDMTVWFDQSLVPGGDISADCDQVQNWTCPTDFGPDQKTHPPKVTFSWGMFRFVGHVSSVKINYRMFGVGGRPLRAEVNVSLKENPDTLALTNPSSGGIAGRKMHVLSEGDSLQSIAYAEYGKPSMWRVLAEANGIDDPLRVPPGTALLIPPTPSAGPDQR
jgi:hypothetical protein